MGKLAMIILTIVAFLIINAFTHWWIALICTVAFFASWVGLNIYSALRGMVAANLRVYFNARKRGSPHEEALGWMIQTRYRNDPSNQLRVHESVSSHSQENDECGDIQIAIVQMFGIENGLELQLQATPKICAMVAKKYSKRAKKAF